MSEGMDMGATAGQDTIPHIINEVVRSASSWHGTLVMSIASLLDPEL